MAQHAVTTSRRRYVQALTLALTVSLTSTAVHIIQPAALAHAETNLSSEDKDIVENHKSTDFEFRDVGSTLYSGIDYSFTPTNVNNSQGFTFSKPDFMPSWVSVDSNTGKLTFKIPNDDPMVNTVIGLDENFGIYAFKDGQKTYVPISKDFVIISQLSLGKEVSYDSQNVYFGSYRQRDPEVFKFKPIFATGNNEKLNELIKKNTTFEENKDTPSFVSVSNDGVVTLALSERMLPNHSSDIVYSQESGFSDNINPEYWNALSPIENQLHVKTEKGVRGSRIFSREFLTEGKPIPGWVSVDAVIAGKHVPVRVPFKIVPAPGMTDVISEPKEQLFWEHKVHSYTLDASEGINNSDTYAIENTSMFGGYMPAGDVILTNRLDTAKRFGYIYLSNPRIKIIEAPKWVFLGCNNGKKIDSVTLPSMCEYKNGEHRDESFSGNVLHYQIPYGTPPGEYTVKYQIVYDDPNAGEQPVQEFKIVLSKPSVTPHYDVLSKDVKPGQTAKAKLVIPNGDFYNQYVGPESQISVVARLGRTLDERLDNDHRTEMTVDELSAAGLYHMVGDNKTLNDNNFIGRLTIGDKKTYDGIVPVGTGNKDYVDKSAKNNTGFKVTVSEGHASFQQLNNSFVDIEVPDNLKIRPWETARYDRNVIVSSHAMDKQGYRLGDKTFNEIAPIHLDIHSNETLLGNDYVDASYADSTVSQGSEVITPIKVTAKDEVPEKYRSMDRVVVDPGFVSWVHPAKDGVSLVATPPTSVKPGSYDIPVTVFDKLGGSKVVKAKVTVDALKPVVTTVTPAPVTNTVTVTPDPVTSVVTTTPEASTVVKTTTVKGKETVVTKTVAAEPVTETVTATPKPIVSTVVQTLAPVTVTNTATTVATTTVTPAPVTTVVTAKSEPTTVVTTTTVKSQPVEVTRTVTPEPVVTTVTQTPAPVTITAQPEPTTVTATPIPDPIYSDPQDGSSDTSSGSSTVGIVASILSVLGVFGIIGWFMNHNPFAPAPAPAPVPEQPAPAAPTVPARDPHEDPEVVVHPDGTVCPANEHIKGVCRKS